MTKEKIDRRHQNPGRPPLPEEEKKVVNAYRLRPREHKWIKANIKFIEEQASK